MEQQIDKGSLDLEQLINSIFTDFHEIEEGKKLEFPEIKEQSTVFIFLGSFNQQIEKVYQKYQKSVVMMETKYIKLVEIENYYLLHFPLILQYDNKFDARLDLFISKHHAESALIKIQNCKFHLILDIQQIQGDDDNGKLDNLIKDSVFFFGKYYFKEENFGYLRLIQEDQWEYTFIKGSSIFDLIFKNQKYQTQTVKTENILGQILIKSNTQDYQKQEFINYGLLMTYLYHQKALLSQEFTLLLQGLQKNLLLLQQMPILKKNQDAIQEVANYLKELYNYFQQEEGLVLEDFEELSKVFELIEKVNQGEYAQKINYRLKNSFSEQMTEFLENNHLQELTIHPYLKSESWERLKYIIQFFKNYQSKGTKFKEYDYQIRDTINEVSNLKINLQFWSSYCEQELENILYELNYITKRIQKGPENEIENGIYLIGITKSGKSTLMNVIFNPNKIEITKLFGNKCYTVANDRLNSFKIGGGAISETQKIGGVYFGQEEEIQKIFGNANFQQNKEEKEIYSYLEMMDQELFNKLQIPQNWFIFDCPGFDDNNNELMRIAHRISLSNYFKKTKNIIIFFLIDISSQNVEQVKNTFNPINFLLKDKKDIQEHYKEWTNLILTKCKSGIRQEYLIEKQWQLAFKGQLDQNFGYFKKLFEDEERCMEFEKPSGKSQQSFEQLVQKIINNAKTQLNQIKIKPTFQLVLDDKVWTLYENCIPQVKHKFECILKFLLQDLDQYILQSEDTIYTKNEQFQKINEILIDKNNNKKTDVITKTNCKEFLYNLKSWIMHNHYLKKNCFFLEQYIQDLESFLEISKYCDNLSKLVSFEINIAQLNIKIQQILLIILETINYYNNWKKGYYAASILGGIISLGSSLAVLEFQIMLNLTRQFLLTRSTLLLTSVASGTIFGGSTGAGIGVNLIDQWKNQKLKEKYQNFLQEEKKQTCSNQVQQN